MPFSPRSRTAGRHVRLGDVRVPERGGLHRVEAPAHQRRVVQAGAVRAERDAVGAAFRALRRRVARVLLPALHHGPALHELDEAVLGPRAGVIRQPPHHPPAVEVDHEDRALAGLALVGDVGQRPPVAPSTRRSFREECGITPAPRGIDRRILSCAMSIATIFAPPGTGVPLPSGRPASSTQRVSSRSKTALGTWNSAGLRGAPIGPVGRRIRIGLHRAVGHHLAERDRLRSGEARHHHEHPPVSRDRQPGRRGRRGGGDRQFQRTDGTLTGGSRCGRRGRRAVPPRGRGGPIRSGGGGRGTCASWCSGLRSARRHSVRRASFRDPCGRESRPNAWRPRPIPHPGIRRVHVRVEAA